MSELLELAERCEQATGPDRELDAEIGAIAASEFLGFQVGKQPGCQAYTASIDAAMTLVPEGWWLHNLAEFNQRTWDAVLRGPIVSTNRLYVYGRTNNEKGIATPALALCAAALRARAASDTQQVQR